MVKEGTSLCFVFFSGGDAMASFTTTLAALVPNDGKKEVAYATFSFTQKKNYYTSSMERVRKTTDD